MTNKTEMVSVPLYATEQMKRAGMERMAQAQRDGSASLYAYAAVCWEAMIECYQESAAPAGDVRAVWEEPVSIGVLMRDCDERIVFESSGEIHIRDGMEVFSHPPRPFVLPERIIGQQHGDKIAEAEQRGWNACLDAVEALNK